MFESWPVMRTYSLIDAEEPEVARECLLLLSVSFIEVLVCLRGEEAPLALADVLAVL